MASRMAAKGLIQRSSGAAGEQAPTWLTVDNARLLADRLSHLRGAAMKMGQMLSLHSDQLLPKEFADALGRLRSNADVMPQSQVEEVLAHAYGGRWRERFADIEMTPLASASIGQVHLATSLDGRRLALKIQYPGVRESIDSDVDNLASLVALGRMLPNGLDLRAVIGEVKRQLHAEADYRREAEQGLMYAQCVRDEPGLRVPRIDRELTTESTLAMEYIDAPNLFEWAEGASQEQRDWIGAQLVRLTLRELLIFRLSQTDPNMGNYLWDPQQQRIVLLDFGATQPVPIEISRVYAAVLRAGMKGDPKAMRDALELAGAIDPQLPPQAADFYVGIALSATALLREAGRHHFGTDDLMRRLRSWAKEGLKHGMPLRSPPAELTFFQRKVGGTYLMCRRLHAAVDCRTIAEETLTTAAL